MLKKLLSWLFPSKSNPATPFSDPDMSPVAKFHQGRQPLPDGVEDIPFLVYMHTPVYAKLLTEFSSISCYYAPTLDDVEKALDEYDFCGILALSPMDQSGAAYQAIDMYREKHGDDGLVIYHGWDYRIEVSAPRALKCKADALMIGSVEGNEFLQFFFTLLQLKKTGQIPEPLSLDWYSALLHQFFLQSPLWQMADILRENEAPIN